MNIYIIFKFYIINIFDKLGIGDWAQSPIPNNILFFKSKDNNKFHL